MFRVTRDADFEVSDEADDLLQAVEDELRRRRFGEVVRLEVGASMDPALRARLIDWLEVDEVQVYDVEGLLDMGDLWQIAGARGPLGDPPDTLDASHPPGVPTRSGQPGRSARRVRADAHARRARALPLPLVRDQRRAVRQAGGRRPQRAGDQDDRVPDLGRFCAGAIADRGGREGQAGRGAGRAQGSLRRASEHRLVPRAGRSRRPRRARHPGPEDPRQGDPRRAARARRRAPLRDDRDRQLPRQERPAVRGLRPVHHRSGDRPGGRRPVQHADG